MEVLFVCTGNICRSPMAEGLMRTMLIAQFGSRVHAHSAGVQAWDGRPAEPFAVQAAAELGASIEAHRARSIHPEMVESAALILVMEPFQHEIVSRVLTREHRKRVRLLGDFDPRRPRQIIDDPYGQSLDEYRNCARTIAACLKGVRKEIARFPVATCHDPA
jgi:protein-tyrosine-phosphatase